MKRFNSFKVLNAALGEVSQLSFEVLYYILNNLKLHNTSRCEIQRINIVLKLKLWDAETETQRKLKKKLDEITNCTNELEAKGFLKKDVIFDSTTKKRKTFYSVGDSFLTETEPNSVQFEQETEPKKGVYKRTKELKEKKELKETKELNNERTENSKELSDEEILSILDKQETELQYACSDTSTDKLPF
jgi:hypothetical protein